MALKWINLKLKYSTSFKFFFKYLIILKVNLSFLARYKYPLIFLWPSTFVGRTFQKNGMWTDEMLDLNGTIFIVACFLYLFLLYMNKNKKAPILIIHFREVEREGWGGRSFIYFCFVLFCFNELEEFLNI